MIFYFLVFPFFLSGFPISQILNLLKWSSNSFHLFKNFFNGLGFWKKMHVFFCSTFCENFFYLSKHFLKFLFLLFIIFKNNYSILYSILLFFHGCNIFPNSEHCNKTYIKISFNLYTICFLFILFFIHIIRDRLKDFGEAHRDSFFYCRLCCVKIWLYCFLGDSEF